jgi:hypothetical protein
MVADMIEVVVALLMMVNGEIKEARIQPGLKTCLEGARKARRGVANNIRYACVRSKAELEVNIDGSLSIKKLILK